MRKVIYELDDDITGEPGASTVRFAYAGAEMEIDLTPDSKKTLDEFMAVYMEHGRRVEHLPKRKPISVAPARRRRERMSTVENHLEMVNATPPTVAEQPSESAMKQYSRVEILPSGVTESVAIRSWYATRPERHAKPLGAVGRIPAAIRDLWIANGRPIVRR